MKTIRKQNAALMALALSMLACNMPTPNSTQAPISPTATNTPSQGQTTGGNSSSPAQGCKPSVITNTIANVRTGPGLVYDVIGNIPAGGSANVSGKSADSAWWYIDFPAGQGGHAWVAGSVTTAACIPTSLVVIAAPPVPVSQQNNSNNDSQGSNSNNNTNDSNPASAPNAPTSVKATTSCSGGRIDLITWHMTDNNVDGYIIYKENNKIAKLTKDQAGGGFIGTYESLPGNIEPPITYGVVAYNSTGKSDMITAKALGCP